MIEAELVVLNGPASGKATPIRPGQDISVGRKIDANSMPISDGYMSRQHFIVGVTDDEFWLQDCGSSHGTYWNDQKIEGRIALKNADRIRAGSTDFVVRIREPAATEVPDAPAARSPQRAPSETAGFDEPIAPKPEDSWSGAVSSSHQPAPPPAPVVPPPVVAVKPPLSPPAPPKAEPSEAPSVFDREEAPPSEVPSIYDDAPSEIAAPEPPISEADKPPIGNRIEPPPAARSSIPAKSSVPASPASFDDAWDDPPAEEENPQPAVSPSATSARSSASPPTKEAPASTSAAESTSAGKSTVPPATRAPAKPMPAASSIDWDDEPVSAEPPPSRPVEKPAKKPADDDDWWPE